jgi:hypothetical protein
MTDAERRHWRNLIYLCTPHHNYVDKVKPQDYPIELLERWKSDRETGAMAQLRGLSELTEDRLQEMITYGMKETAKELHAAIARIEPTDPDTALLLREATRRLNADTVDMLQLASSSLAPTLDPDNVEMLFTAADMLRQADLSQATSQLSDLLDQIQATISELRGMQDFM